MKRKYSVCQDGGEVSICKGEYVAIEPFIQFRINKDRWVTRDFPLKKLSVGGSYTFSMTITVHDDYTEEERNKLK
jgi:hypothetical protein